MKTIVTFLVLFSALFFFVVPAQARKGNPANAGTNTAPKSQYYLIDSDEDGVDARQPSYKFVDTLYDPTHWYRVTNFTNTDDGYAEITPHIISIGVTDSINFVYMDQVLRLPPRYIGTNGVMKLTKDTLTVFGYGSPITTPTNGPIPTGSANPLGAMIAPLWGDMELRTAGDSSKVFWRMTTDSCYVTYYNLALKGSNGTIRATFQVVFCNTDSTITFNYKSFDGAYNATPADTVMMNEATIGVQNYRSTYGTMYLDRGTYYAVSYGSQLYAKGLHAGLAVKFIRVTNQAIRMVSIDDPPYDRYEMLGNSFQPKCTVENFDAIDREIYVKSVVTDLSTGNTLYNRTDSVGPVARGFNQQLTASVYQGFPCGKYRLTMTATVPSYGTDGWTQDNVMTRDFTFIKTLNPPIYDNFASSKSIIDPCNWHIDGATWVNASTVFCDPASPNSSGAALLNRRDVKGEPYLTSTGSDTMTSAPMNIKGLSNVWFSFSYQRGLCSDSMKAGIKNRVLIGPEPLDMDSVNQGVYQGDSLLIEGLLATGTAFNDTTTTHWARIGLIYGGLDYVTQKYRIQLDPKFIHDHLRIRLRLAAKDDHLKYGFPLDDDDNWLVDNFQVSSPTNGQTDLEVMNVDLGAGNFTHIPRNVKLITPLVTIANNGLLTNAGVFNVHVLIKDALGRAVYDKVGSIVQPAAHSSVTIPMTVWDIQGSQGGVFTVKVNFAQNWNEYYRINDTNTFYRTMYIDDRYALDDGVPDTAGTMKVADNNFYYDFIPLASDSLRGMDVYNLGPSGNTNWTINILDNSTPPKVLATRAFSYNADSLKGSFKRSLFSPYYMTAGTLYRLQCIETQGRDVGGDGSKGLMWETTHGFNSPGYTALHPDVVSSFRNSANTDYVTAKKNASGGGPILPMIRLVFSGSANFLPVEIASFSARRTDLGSVNLGFRTAKEESVDHFEIDRESSSGWMNAGNITALNERLGASYSLLDEKAPTSSITYRLMEVDLDGTRRLVGTTNVGPFGTSEAFGVRVYPNPTSQNIHVILSEGYNDVSLLLFDATGKVVASKEHVSGNSVDIDAKSLSSGSYWLEARSGENYSRMKVSVTK
jgi:hypothetical protein